MKTENDLIVLSNELLESKHSYTELEAKVIFNFASLIKKDDSDFWTYSIQAKSIGDRKELKKLCISIMSKAITIDKSIKKTTNIFEYIHILLSVFSNTVFLSS